jgi:hypothetical protein
VRESRVVQTQILFRSGTGEVHTADRIEKITNGQFTADLIRVDLNRFD